jgi:YhcH/YjgK/YiaL family protein
VIYDTIENLGKYCCYDKRFALIEAFLAEHNVLTIPAGSYTLEGGITANVSEYAPGKGDKFEAHRKFTDLQYVVSGNERIELIPLADARESTGYQPDIEFFAAQASASTELIMNSGTFAVFEPQDAHRPCIKHISDTIKKIVFKIPVK